MSTSSIVSAALDTMFDRDSENSIIAHAGKRRRCELLDRLDIGDVSTMTIVDFGMGTRGFASVFPKLHGCARAIGMDISNRAIEASRNLVAQTNPPYAAHFETYQSDGMSLPLPDGSVDLFFSGETIERVNFPPRFLSEIHRVLKPDGQLVITTPNRDAIKYKEQFEQYCTSPEHFWLFSYPELVETVKEYFGIREVFGFNASFGSHTEDLETLDERWVEDWSKRFEDEPGLATGVVMSLTKKPQVDFVYEVGEISPLQEIVKGSDVYLDLELGLRGLLLDRPDQSIVVRRPPSDGIVMRFWSHRWSGIAELKNSDSASQLDLYTFAPGWQNWQCRDATKRSSEMEIRMTGARNSKSDGHQVIYFGAFTWWKVPRSSAVSSAAAIFASARASSQLESNIAAPAPDRAVHAIDRSQSRSEYYQAGYGFQRFKPFVGTTVFLWFSPNEGNIRGPWPPLGGRESWTGKKDFWIAQIKEMMLANIDAIYLHCIESFGEQRLEFFKAYSQLRSQGWDVPKIAPFLDPFNYWRDCPIDVATKEGKDAFVEPLVRFFEGYFEQNTDKDAASFLLHIDGRVVLSTWWVYSLVKNLDQFTREDVTRRLRARLEQKLPQLRQGVYMMTTALVDPDLAFSDERMIMFSGYAYAIHSIHCGVDVWHVQAGYWDQNIRAPGYFLPRDGGSNYRRAWEAVIAAIPHVQRVYVESWNEYDEGSGIYSADPNGMFADASVHQSRDVYSHSGNPYEYIDTTAWGASKINGHPMRAASVFAHEAPTRAPAGSRLSFGVGVRNEGNERWLPKEGYALHIVDANGSSLRVIEVAADMASDVAPSRGVVRGQPIWFSVELDVPEHEGEFAVGAVFAFRKEIISDRLDISIRVLARN